MKPDIVRRYSGNPILTKAAIPYPVETVHNAAVVKHGDEYVMLFRSHLRTGRSIKMCIRDSMSIESTGTRERNQRLPFCSLWLRCGWRKTH